MITSKLTDFLINDLFISLVIFLYFSFKYFQYFACVYYILSIYSRMGVFTLITTPLLFAVLSMAGNASTSNPFIYILSQCCELKSSASHLSDINLLHTLCPVPRYPLNLILDTKRLCNNTVKTDILENCVNRNALEQNIIVLSVNNSNNTLDISYRPICSSNNILYSIFVVIVFVLLAIVALVTVICILCVIMQNQRKRKLHLRGSSYPETSILTIECGMERANKRPGPNSPELMPGAPIQPSEAYQNRVISSLSPHPSHLSNNAEDTCYSHFTQASSYLSYELPNQVPNLGHFNFSPPRSPAPVSHNSSVFTFDFPNSLQPELSHVVTPANILDEGPSLSHLKPFRSETFIPSLPPDSVGRALHFQRFYQRSQSAVTSSNNMNSQQLGMRRGIQLKIDLAYESQSDLCSTEKSLNLSRRINPEQLVRILINEEDLSVEYSGVPMNKDKVAIPGTGHKNRYADILPNRCSRVVLQDVNSDVISGYINANHIMSSSNNSYIAAQGPLRNTVDDFWRMVIEMNSSTVVMITTLEETDQSRCYKYWPQIGESECYGRTKVTFVSQSKEIDYIKTHFRVSLNQNSDYKLVTHYWYTTWPDHGVPSSPEPILSLIKEVNINNTSHSDPIIIHCSAGVGRTGCYIAIDIGQEQLKKYYSVDILGTLCSMRRDRGTMIQTFDQYLFVYHALSHFSYTEQLISPKLRSAYQGFIASMMSPISGFPPKFYNSSNKYIDELMNETNSNTATKVPHHEILTTPSISVGSVTNSFSFQDPGSPQVPASKPDPPSNQMFLFPQITKSAKRHEVPPLHNINEITPENTNPNIGLFPSHSGKQLQPIYFDFPAVSEESPKPKKKKNIPQRLTLSSSSALPSPEPLSCPVPDLLTPTNCRPDCEPSFFFSEQRSEVHSNSASYLTKDQHFTFPDPPSRRQRSCEHTAFPFGNLTIRTNTPNSNIQFAFSDNNLGRGCCTLPTNESTPYSSFTWPSGVKRIPVTSGSPITPRTPTLVH